MAVVVETAGDGECLRLDLVWCGRETAVEAAEDTLRRLRLAPSLYPVARHAHLWG